MSVQYQIRCDCGRKLRVSRKHFGHMCGCPKCHFRIYVSADSVEKSGLPPTLSRRSRTRQKKRRFEANEVPVHWEKGDVFMGMYKVVGVLGKGGMGIVYKVRHLEWGINMAVKSLRAELLSRAGLTEVFEKECETWVNLAPHPNSVKCYYVRRMGGAPRVFVEYVRGQSLHSSMYDGSLYQGTAEETRARILDSLIQFCWGLHHAHEQGVIHQDVKPSNVMIGKDGVAKVTDFGLARFRLAPNTNGVVYDHRALGGTPSFRSPEQKVRGEATPKIDIWGWGLSALALFNGALNWYEGERAQQLLAEYRRNGPLRSAVPPMPDEVAQLLQWCFEESPDKRPEDLAAVAHELEDIYRQYQGTPYPRPHPQAVVLNADILNNRAVSLLDLRKEQEARILWDEAIELNPRHIESHYNKNLHLWRSGELTDSRVFEALSCVETLDADPAMLRYLYGRLLLERGDFRRADTILGALRGAITEQREVRLAVKHAREQIDNTRRFLWRFRAHETPVTAVSLSYDGWRGLTGSEDGSIKLWEMLTGMCGQRFVGHRAAIQSLCISGDEQFAVSGSADHTVRVWNVGDGRCLRTLNGHRAPVTGVAVSTDKTVAVSGSLDGAVKIWGLSTGQCRLTLSAHPGGVTQVDIVERDKRLLSCGYDGRICLWDIRTGRLQQELTDETGPVNAVAMLPELGIMVSAGNEGVARVWSIATGECLRSFTGHHSPIQNVAVSDEGALALTASSYGTLKLWSVDSCQCLKTFEGHAPMDLSRDGRYAMSGDEDGCVKTWAVHAALEAFPASYVRCRENK